MKKFIAYIFLIVFSFQVLPVKELGRILFKGMMTEEIHEAAADESSETKIKKEPDPKFHLKYEALASVQHFTAISEIAIHGSELLPRHFMPDILTPPPNFA